ncbi:MAG: XdhC family protein [Kiloniellales bacterium]
MSDTSGNGVADTTTAGEETNTAIYPSTDRVLRQAAAWRNDGRKAALATVVATWGSSPRPVGSQLAIDEEGRMLGSVSGGCIEGAVVTEALEVMEDGKPRLLEFGVSDENAWEVGLACGGRVQVFVETLD